MERGIFQAALLFQVLLNVPFMRITFSASIQPNILTIGEDVLLHSTFAHVGSIFALFTVQFGDKEAETGYGLLQGDKSSTGKMIPPIPQRSRLRRSRPPLGEC